ncbi:MAG: M24B family metallopeptidase, partial [Pseudomonadota bacterium]
MPAAPADPATTVSPADADHPAPAAPIAALQAWLNAAGYDGLLIPRADRHQGEFVAPQDERLAWATGFTGSAGLAVVLRDAAALFVDGRYEIQGARQVDPARVETAPVRKLKPEAWLKAKLPEGGRIAYDPWLHGVREIERFAGSGLSFEPLEANPIDALWRDRPASGSAPAFAHPARYAGESAAEKRARIAAILETEKLDLAVLTQPDAICWLLNLRGADTPHTPLLQAYSLIDAKGGVRLYCDPAKIPPDLEAALGEKVAIADWAAFAPALERTKGLRVALDKSAAPAAAAHRLQAAGATIVWRDDPTALAKARKNPVEIAGARAAHLRDGAAMAAFLAWLEQAAAGGAALDEAMLGAELRRCRAETAARLGEPLQDESFPPIIGFGANGAVVHHRAEPGAAAAVAGDGLLLIDSGGQYRDGTTDVTRTVAIGTPGPAEIAGFTAVLQGMIAISTLKFPKTLAGRDIDAFARRALWARGEDYDHGTGHGVGSYLGVHEGPQRLSRLGLAALEPGMILSNEPGLYVEGAFGVRIENLILVREAEKPAGGRRPMLS